MSGQDGVVMGQTFSKKGTTSLSTSADRAENVAA
jgi:hypothetical protein